MAEEAEYKKIRMNGTLYKFPNDMDDGEIKDVLKRKNEDLTYQPPVETPKPEYKPFSQVPESIAADQLINTPEWMDASSRLYRVVNRKPFAGSPEELEEWSRSTMAYFNYNIVSTGRMANRLLDADQTDKEAFLYMMDTFDNTDMSWEGAGNATKAVLLDPTTYAGLATFGAGLLGKQALKSVGKEGLKFKLKESLGRTGIMTGTEAAMYSYVDDRIRQNIEVDAGRKQERDATQSLIASGTGFVAGAGLGVGMDLLARSVGKYLGKATAKQEDVDKVLDIVEPDAPKVGEVSGEVVDKPKPKSAVVDDGVIKVGGLELPAYARELARRNPSLADSIEFADGVSLQMQQLNPADTDGLAKALGIERLTLREAEEVSVAAQAARNNLTDELDRAIRVNLNNPTIANQNEVVKLADLQDSIEAVDKVFRNSAGWMLRARQDQITTYNDLTIPSIREELQEAAGDIEVPDEIVQLEFLKRKMVANETHAQQQIARKYDDEARELARAGDLKGAMNKAYEKNKAMGSLNDLVQENEAGFSAKLVEGSIANVFSITTLQVNALASSAKTFSAPALRALVSNPLELANRKQLSASYGAMKSTIGGAWRASVTAYRLEQSILTRDPNKYLENALAIKGKKGGAMRFFIRMTTATDEFLSQLNYSSFVAGSSAYDAVLDAQKKGLTGGQLNAFVDKRVKAALADAYEMVDAEQALIPVLTKGKNLGLTGDKLEAYVLKEVSRDAQSLRVANTKDNATNQAGVTALRDVLYKRELSGEGAISAAAQSFEETMNKIPSLKLLTGQLFIRTPIRVFEEAIRITPAAQFLAPRFLSDIRGLNGPERQLQARAQSMVSIAMLGSVMTLYSEGRITGGGANTDWRQDALQRDSAEQDPFTIRGEDGNTWSYRFTDPIASPMKAIVTALEHMDALTIRKAQGEDIPEDAMIKAGEYLQIVGLSLYKTFKDANLLAGFGGFAGAVEASLNPEDRTSAWLRFIGDKMRLAIPATIRKEAVPFQEGMRDPATILQMAQAQLIDPFTNNPIADALIGEDKGVKTSYAYDHMGRRKTTTDLGILRGIFSVATPEEREKVRSEAELYVDEQLVRLQETTGVVLRVPNKHESTGGRDYRAILTKDGSETLYDRWNELYRQTLNVPALAKILEAPLPDGTMKHKGAKVQVVQEFINKSREIAHTKLLAEQESVLDMTKRTAVTKILGETGQYDVDRKTNPPTLDQLLNQ